MHPRAIENATKRDAMLAEKKRRHEYAQRVAAEKHLHFVHVRRTLSAVDDEEQEVICTLSKGGVSLAYQRVQAPFPKGKHQGHDFVKVACAIVHNNDCYNKKEGRYQVVNRFDKGEHILLRVPKGETVPYFLKYMFSAMV